MRADEIRGRPDLDVEAVGNAELRRSDIRIRADRLSYDQANDVARAIGNVRISHDGNRYSGPELQIRLETFEGFFMAPTFVLGRTGAVGSASRMDFIDAGHAVVSAATYTSCPADGSGGPDWLLSADRIKLDFETNEGVAEGAVLRFLGVPILAAPTVSFPLSEARKSGWLPPIMGIDSRSGFVAGVPYYWNIAPNRDATITPIMRTNRGPGVDGEFRYLEPDYSGTLRLDLLPYDRLSESTRYALNLAHEGLPMREWGLQLHAMRVSDNNYWKDFPDALQNLTRRLLTTDAQLRRDFSSPLGGGDWAVIAAVQAWQPLQGSDASSLMGVPYQRLPQIGARTDQGLGGGFQASFETEFNRFTNPTGVIETSRLTGLRLHAIGTLARPIETPGWTLTPRLSFNAASYALDQPMSDGRTTASRIIPTASLDSAWVFERRRGVARQGVSADTGAAPDVRLHTVRQAVVVSAVRHRPEGLQLRVDLHRERFCRRRPGVRRQPAHSRPDQPRHRPRQRRRGLAACRGAAGAPRRPARHTRWTGADEALLRCARRRFDDTASAAGRWQPRCNTTPTGGRWRRPWSARAMRRARFAVSP